jgi:phosphoadenosine phosphosulfate reductase
VVWIDTGKNYPEMLETIARAKALCPNFVEVLVDRVGQNAFHGIPSDVVPIGWTRLGQQFTGEKPFMIQSYLQCCFENFGMQMQAWCKANGITHLIRGQRNDEGHKSSARNGSVVDGITYLQPVEDWTEAQVIDYVSQHMQMPAHFRFKHTSMDCYDCTAFRADSKDRIAYTREHHPVLYAEYAARKAALDEALSQELAQEFGEHLQIAGAQA